MAEVTMRVWRGDATGGDFENYTVERNEGEVVLDIIHRIQATQAPDRSEEHTSELQSH